MQKFFTGFLLLFIILGCNSPTYTKEERVLLLFKTPKIQYRDLGFLYAHAHGVKMEIYSSGEAMSALTIEEDRICSGSFACLNPKGFHRTYLSSSYPSDTLLHIFKGEAIFEGQGVRKEGNASTQILYKEGEYAIEYRIFNKKIFFHDRINAIKITIERLS
jgi:hypothetical protein